MKFDPAFHLTLAFLLLGALTSSLFGKASLAVSLMGVTIAWVAVHQDAGSKSVELLTEIRDLLKETKQGRQ